MIIGNTTYSLWEAYVGADHTEWSDMLMRGESPGCTSLTIDMYWWPDDLKWVLVQTMSNETVYQVESSQILPIVLTNYLTTYLSVIKTDIGVSTQNIFLGNASLLQSTVEFQQSNSSINLPLQGATQLLEKLTDAAVEIPGASIAKVNYLCHVSQIRPTPSFLVAVLGFSLSIAVSKFNVAWLTCIDRSVGGIHHHHLPHD